MKPRVLLVAYGIVNALVYVSLTPLWEGFDEPFHYGYVLELSNGRGFPVLGRTVLPGEIWAAVKLAPASDATKLNIPAVTTFGEYSQLPEGERRERRARLSGIPKDSPPGGLNYEAQQAPLAYVLLAPFDRLWRSADISTRVWRLRAVCGVFAALATGLMLFRLGDRLALPPDFLAALVFLTFSWQMFYGATAHIANDWLAIPLMVLFFDRLAAAETAPGRRNMLSLGAVLAAGLLAKAYFLAVAPLAFAAVAWLAFRRRAAWVDAGWFAAVVAAAAGPWYLRNIALYRSLAGMQQARGGVGGSSLLAAAAHVRWIASARDLIYQSVWTGNGTFRTFSQSTIALLLAGIAAAAVLYAAGMRRGPAPAGERLMAAGCGLFFIALAYNTVVVFWASGGGQHTASPWYTQAIVPVLLCVLCGGLARASYAGRAVTVWLVCVSGYMMAVTYWAKLIPLYAGFDDRTTLSHLIRLYRDDMGTVARGLAETALGDAGWILGGAAAVAAASIGFAVAISRSLMNVGERQRPPRTIMNSDCRLSSGSGRRRRRPEWWSR